MGNLCIIPARGGSKRIPRKNVKHFLDKPIIAYSITTAIESQLFDEIMVSTDDLEISTIAQQYGANVPFVRSAENSDDFATTVDVIKEVLSSYKRIGKEFENVCCIYPTAPFSNSKMLNEGYEKLISEERISVFPVVKFGYPIWRGLVARDEGKIKMAWPEYLDSRSQDLEQVFHDAGQWYWIACKPFEIEEKIFSSNSGFIELNELNVQDIDSEVDWKLAELKYKILYEN